MSVELNISIQENCDSLYFFERTGKYDSKCNKTGWCTPNEDLSAATEAELRIFLPKSTTPIVLDLYPDFPNSQNVGKEILPEDIGQTKFVSGIWQFIYVVTINGVKQAVSCYKLLKNDLECCINSKKKAVTVENFESEEVIDCNTTEALFRSAEGNACEGKISEAQKIIDFLYVRCKCKC